MIQQSLGCDDPDQSVFQGSRSLETVDGPRGKEEREEDEGGGEAIESVESDRVCSWCYEQWHSMTQISQKISSIH